MPSKKGKTNTSQPVVEKVVDEPVVEEKVEVEASSDTLDAKFSDILSKITTFKTWVKELEVEVKKLQKQTIKDLKESAKKSKKGRNNPDKPKRAPSGFAKPSPISQELCDFLGKESGTELARTEVTKHLTTYIKLHNLQAPEDKRKILPDAKLKKLLKIQKGDDITYFNLQKYLKPHFPPKQVSTSS